MKRRLPRWKTVPWLLVAVLLETLPAWATQGHAGVEGVWAHQLAHLFFLFAMGLLIYWLRRAGLVVQPGWRWIQYAALFFILWNLNAFLVHLLDEQFLAVAVHPVDTWEIRIETTGGHTWLALLYYIAKLDHLLCVPAMVCLTVGLRHMLGQVGPPVGGSGTRP